MPPAFRYMRSKCDRASASRPIRCIGSSLATATLRRGRPTVPDGWERTVSVRLVSGEPNWTAILLHLARFALRSGSALAGRTTASLRDVEDASVIPQRLKILFRLPVLQFGNLRLGQAEPSAEYLLVQRLAEQSQVTRMVPVRPEHSANVLTLEGSSQVIGGPELVTRYGRRSELVPLLSVAAPAQARSVVSGERHRAHRTLSPAALVGLDSHADCTGCPSVHPADQRTQSDNHTDRVTGHDYARSRPAPMPTPASGMQPAA